MLPDHTSGSLLPALPVLATQLNRCIPAPCTQVEANWVPQHNQPRCGHIKDNGWGRSFNTGIFAVRNREAGKSVLRGWRDAMLDSEHTSITVVERAVSKQGQGKARQASKQAQYGGSYVVECSTILDAI